MMERHNELDPKIIDISSDQSGWHSDTHRVGPAPRSASREHPRSVLSFPAWEWPKLFKNALSRVGLAIFGQFRLFPHGIGHFWSIPALPAWE
jgi:hypothetical protein